MSKVNLAVVSLLLFSHFPTRYLHSTLGQEDREHSGRQRRTQSVTRETPLLCCEITPHQPDGTIEDVLGPHRRDRTKRKAEDVHLPDSGRLDSTQTTTDPADEDRTMATAGAGVEAGAGAGTMAMARDRGITGTGIEIE
jgi:hypothetical protein